MNSDSKDQLLRRCGIPYLEWRAMFGLGRHGSWREIADQLQKNTVGVNRVNNAPGIGICARAARCDL